MRINTIQTRICEIQQWNVISVCMKSLFFSFTRYENWKKPNILTFSSSKDEENVKMLFFFLQFFNLYVWNHWGS